MKQQSLTEGSIPKGIILFAIPLFLGNLFQQLYNMADSLIVGNFLGNSALAAVTSTGSLIFLLVGIANILDVQVIGTGSVLRTAVIFFYISNEGVSLLENAAHLGLPVPEKIKTVLEQLHDRSESEDE